MEQIKKLFSKEVISYLIFGVLTTVVNLVVFSFLTAVCDVEVYLANAISIICSILFAYFTNRKWVFNSTATTAKEKWMEFINFILGRAVTAVLEMIGLFLLNDIIHSFYGIFSEKIAVSINKCLITVIIIILNFFISKFFAFKN